MALIDKKNPNSMYLKNSSVTNYPQKLLFTQIRQLEQVESETDRQTDPDEADLF